MTDESRSAVLDVIASLDKRDPRYGAELRRRYADARKALTASLIPGLGALDGLPEDDREDGSLGLFLVALNALLPEPDDPPPSRQDYFELAVAVATAGVMLVEVHAELEAVRTS